MNIGVVGLGFMGITHLTNWSKVKGSQVTALVSNNPKKLNGDFSEVGGNLSTSEPAPDISSLRKYSAVEDLMEDPEIEAIDLCVPTDLHKPLAIAGMRAGKHVLLEKPMALSRKECLEILEVARETNKVLMVAQVIRYWPDYLEAKKMVDQNRIGKIDFAVFRRRCGAPGWGGWQNDPARSGGGVFDLLIHDFDFCLHLFGFPQRVCALGKLDPSAGIDWMETELFYPSGPNVVISGGWNPSGCPFSMEFNLLGNDGSLDYHSSLNRLTLYRNGMDPEKFVFSEDDGFRAELQAFSDACKTGQAPIECLPEESALAVEVIHAALESRANKGRPVYMEDQ